MAQVAQPHLLHPGYIVPARGGHHQPARGGHHQAPGAHGAQQQTLLQAITAYSPPHFQPKWGVVPPGQRLPAGVSSNTVNMSYPVETVEDASVWQFNNITMGPLLAALGTVQYDPAALQAQLAQVDPNNRVQLYTVSLQQFMPDYVTVFRHEAALTSRLDATVHNELSRFSRYMSVHSQLNPPWMPDGSTPIIPDVGSSTRLWANYLPDRSARSDEHADPVAALPRLTGDIKPSYKFHSSWRDAALGGVVHDVAHTAIEFKKVLAQVKYYMDNLGVHPDGRSLRYGYIITDEEVVLLKADQANPDSGIQVSEGFPHRGHRHGINGMLALIMIHMLAAVDNGPNFDSYLV